ncbi:MAG: hypothetical protein ACI9ZH_002229 [Paracoccaceae bacterium]|jgi:hypothetical protein
MLGQFLRGALVALAIPVSAHATVITLANNTLTSLAYKGENVLLDTRVSGNSSIFNNNWGIQNSSGGGNDPNIGISNTSKKLGEIGYDANGFFNFSFDMQEAGKNDPGLTIFGAKIEINALNPETDTLEWLTVWELNEGQSLEIYDETLPPPNVLNLLQASTGNNLDLIIKVPAQLMMTFAPNALGSSLARIKWIQFDYSGGNEEFNLAQNPTAGLSFLGDGESVMNIAIPAVPLPAGALLLLSALGAFGIVRRRAA